MKLWRKLMWIAAVSGLTTTALLILSTAKSESKGEEKAVVIGTSSLNGEVSPCG